MKNVKRSFIMLMIAVLMLSFTSCRKRVSFHTDYLEVELTDEEFYGEPDLIFKASVTGIADEYFTNPDGEDYLNAHVTVFDLKISELYKGEWEGEDFQLKMFNGKGLSADLYLYGKDDKYILDEPLDIFLLEVGKEYILGVSSVDPERFNCYNDPGGYLIRYGETWTFVQQEDGTYENLKSGLNHRVITPEIINQNVAALAAAPDENEP